MTFIYTLNSLKTTILDFLFPPFCVSCKKSGEWWCADCRRNVQRLSAPICPRCLSVVSPSLPKEASAELSSGSGVVGSHQNCTATLPFSSVRSFGYYHDPLLRPVITNLKFNGVTALQDAIRQFIRENPSVTESVRDKMLVPMPLSSKRLKERGFNQAEIIANLVAEECGASVTDILKRVGHKDPQSSLEHDLETRQNNIAGCFKVEGEVPKQVVLIDDVITTGATAAEAAWLLKSKGADEVSVLTLAIGA